MADNEFKGPTFRYGPNGESAVFHDSREVPEGWLDDPAKHGATQSKAVGKPSLTRKEMVELLEKGGIAHDPRAKVEVLDAVLREAVSKFLTEANISFDPSAETKALVELLPPVE
jgi:hypothetical protein